MESSEEFKDLSKGQRNCKLENEVEEGSIFKHYTENNCRYECTVDLAIKTCICAPWDFMHKSNEIECDVFGRTCFYRAIENITQDSDNPCNECLPGCDQIKYKKEILKTDKVIKWEIDDTSKWGNKYFNCYYFTEKDTICSGESGFVDFFYDYNSTFMDKIFGLYLITFATIIQPAFYLNGDYKFRQNWAKKGPINAFKIAVFN